MSELMRSMVGRLRTLLNNRRAARRFPVQLPCGVFLANAKWRVGEPPPARAPRVEGMTRDISATGLELVVPSIHVGGRYLAGETVALSLSLKLPTGSVELRVVPVRYEHLPDDGDERGYLIGVHIETMTDPDRALYNEHLRQLGTD